MRRLDSIADPVALLKGIFEHAPVAFQVYTKDGHCLLVNQAFRELFGSEPPPEYNVFHDDIVERQGFQGLVRRAFEGETVRVPPMWYDPRDLRHVEVLVGKRAGIEVTLFPLLDHRGQVEHVALCIKDVTAELEGKRTTEALAESEARKAAVIEAALDCIISMDHRGMITEFNPAAERTFGYSRSEAIGKPLAELIIPPSFRAAHREGLRRHNASGDGPLIGKRTELMGMRADGSEFPLEVIVTRIGSNGGPPTFTGFLRDLTESKRVQEALVDSERRFRRLADAGIIGIITADLRGNILDANNAFLEMVGYSADEVRSGRVRWSDITPSEWRHLDDRAVVQLQATGVASPWEKEYFRKDGSRIPVLVGVTMLDSTKGECVCFILDRTEHQRAAAAIERFRQEREAGLKTSIQVRDDFLAVAGHELKTPLAAMLLQIQGLQRGLRKDPAMPVAERLDKAASAGLRLSRLVGQLLDVSRIRAGRLRLEPEPVDLSDLVRGVVSRSADATKPPATIAVHGAAHVQGQWDRLRVEQVAENLVGNAIKYGLGRPIDVELQAAGDEAVLRVIDHGIGIDAEHQRKIFQRFERAVAAREFGGFGLGLWISQQIVEASGGRIEVQSELGQGATFTVRLPVVPPWPVSAVEGGHAHG